MKYWYDTMFKVTPGPSGGVHCECYFCGAVVGDRRKHYDWHVQQINEGTHGTTDTHH